MQNIILKRLPHQVAARSRRGNRNQNILGSRQACPHFILRGAILKKMDCITCPAQSFPLFRLTASPGYFAGVLLKNPDQSQSAITHSKNKKPRASRIHPLRLVKIRISFLKHFIPTPVEKKPLVKNP